VTLLGVAPCRVSDVPAGSFLFHQDDPARHVYEVIAGKVALLRHTPAGDNVVLYCATRGECLNEAALFSGVYHCSARTVTAARLALYRKGELLSTLRGDGERMEGFAAALARRVRDLRAQLELRSIRSAGERLYRYLLLRCDPESSEVRLRSTLKQIAQEIGLTHEALYRAARALEREGRIARYPDRIVLLGDPRR